MLPASCFPIGVVASHHLMGVRTEYVGISDKPAVAERVNTGRCPGLDGR